VEQLHDSPSNCHKLGASTFAGSMTKPEEAKRLVKSFHGLMPLTKQTRSEELRVCQVVGILRMISDVLVLSSHTAEYTRLLSWELHYLFGIHCI
jgi:hypothetical protein